MMPLDPTSVRTRYLSCQTRLEFHSQDAPRFLSPKGARAGTTALYVVEEVTLVYSWMGEDRPNRWEPRATLMARRIRRDGTPGDVSQFDWYLSKRPYDGSDEVDGIMSLLSARYLPPVLPAVVADDTRP